MSQMYSFSFIVERSLLDAFLHQVGYVFEEIEKSDYDPYYYLNTIKVDVLAKSINANESFDKNKNFNSNSDVYKSVIKMKDLEIVVMWSSFLQSLFTSIKKTKDLTIIAVFIPIDINQDQIGVEYKYFEELSKFIENLKPVYGWLHDGMIYSPQAIFQEYGEKFVESPWSLYSKTQIFGHQFKKYLAYGEMIEDGTVNRIGEILYYNLKNHSNLYRDVKINESLAEIEITFNVMD